ncbi:MAG: MucBP domain-containing protein, partial [Vagococcus salmoninarum]|uniref:MucBP domain-containing protein n=1 Tax=Vagococcus salmoninarum TaxID=2739 RepID=UPI003F9E7EB4
MNKLKNKLVALMGISFLLLGQAMPVYASLGFESNVSKSKLNNQELVYKDPLEQNQLKEINSKKIVNIPDANLEIAIKRTLNITSETITENDMLQLNILLLNNNEPVSNLTGLEYATNLRDLNIQLQRLDSIEALRNLKKLEYVDVSGNDIKDLTPLTNSNEIFYLNLEGNPVTDFSGISTLTNLETLIANNTKIIDISDLSNLVNIKKMVLPFNIGYENINPLKKMTNMKSLTIGGGKTKDISFINNMPLLDELVLMNVPNSDLTPLTGALKNITYLTINNAGITDTGFLTGLDKLEVLNLSDNKIEDVTGLIGNMPETVRSIDLGKNSIWDFSPFLTRPEIKVTTAGQIINLKAGVINKAEERKLLDPKGKLATTITIKPADAGVYDKATGNLTWLKPSLIGTPHSLYLRVGATNVTFYQDVYETAQEEGTVKIIHRGTDAAQTQVAPTQETKGTVGSSYNTTPVIVAGWRLNKTPTNSSGTYKSSVQEVIYLYDKIPTEGKVVVDHVDEKGVPIAAQTSHTGKIGSNVTVAPVSVTGWAVETKPTNETITITENEQKVKYIYKQVMGAEVTVTHKGEDGTEVSPTVKLTGQ